MLRFSLIKDKEKKNSCDAKARATNEERLSQSQKLRLQFRHQITVSPSEIWGRNQKELRFKIGIHKIQFGENFHVHLIKVTHEQNIISYQELCFPVLLSNRKTKRNRINCHESSKYKTYLIRLRYVQQALILETKRRPSESLAKIIFS